MHSKRQGHVTTPGAYSGHWHEYMGVYFGRRLSFLTETVLGHHPLFVSRMEYEV